MSAPRLPGSGLSEDERISCLIMPALLTSPRWARRQIAAALAAWQLPDDVVQSAEMVASELVANATAISRRLSSGNGAARAEKIEVALRLLPDQVVIEVTDNDPRLPALAEPGADDENGRGLVMVQAISEKWGYRVLPSGGKVVYAILSAPENTG